MDRIDQFIFIFPLLLLIIWLIIWFIKSNKFLKANKMLNEWKYEEAIKLYKDITTKNKNHKIAHYNMWIALEKLNRYEEALAAYDEVIKLDNSYELAYRAKGIILDYKLGKYEEAIKTYNEINRINPKSTLNHLNKALALWILGRNEEAIEEWNLALNTYDEQNKNKETWKIKWWNKWLIYYFIASTYSFMNKEVESIENLKKAIEFDKQYKEEAKTDKAFDNIRNSDEFKKTL